MSRLKMVRIPADKIAIGDLIHWRGVSQRVLGIEEGQGMPWPVDTKWRSLHLDRPSGAIEYGYCSTVVFEAGTTIVKVEVIPCALSASKR